LWVVASEFEAEPFTWHQFGSAGSAGLAT
jgi:hypothetical protein